MEERRTTTILYCRLPGLLSNAAHGPRPHTSPVAVSDGRAVRDVCPVALAQGVKVGMGVVQARRLCPTLLVVPRENVGTRPWSTQLWNILADLSPAVEPGDADDAYVDITGMVPDAVEHDLRQVILVRSGLMPVIGVGVSRLAARACAECNLPAERLADATVGWLWPEDKAVLGWLQRLGLTSFGAVADVPEVYQRIGAAVYGDGLAVVTGRAEKDGEGVALLVDLVAEWKV